MSSIKSVSVPLLLIIIIVSSNAITFNTTMMGFLLLCAIFFFLGISFLETNSTYEHRFFSPGMLSTRILRVYFSSLSWSLPDFSLHLLSLPAIVSGNGCCTNRLDDAYSCCFMDTYAVTWCSYFHFLLRISVPVADIKAVVTGKDCPHMKEKGALKQNKVWFPNYSK